MLSWSLGKESNYSRELHVIGSDGAEIVKLYFFACILLCVCVCVGGGGTPICFSLSFVLHYPVRNDFV